MKLSSEAEAKSCVENLNNRSEYLQYEEDADFEDAFHQERESCDAETPDWY